MAKARTVKNPKAHKPPRSKTKRDAAQGRALRENESERRKKNGSTVKRGK